MHSKLKQLQHPRPVSDAAAASGSAKPSPARVLLRIPHVRQKSPSQAISPLEQVTAVQSAENVLQHTTFTVAQGWLTSV